jgi:hypothetical protein
MVSRMGQNGLNSRCEKTTTMHQAGEGWGNQIIDEQVGENLGSRLHRLSYRQ